jgi:hypothetical protein
MDFNMNLRRGLFRVWVVLSALFIAYMAFMSFDEIKSEFSKAADLKSDNHWWNQLPVACEEARGQLNDDYTRDSSPNPSCWYKKARYHILYPEDANLSDDELREKFFGKPGQYRYHLIPDRPHPWTTLLQTATIALGFPLIIFIVGSALLWAGEGFRRR